MQAQAPSTAANKPLVQDLSANLLFMSSYCQHQSLTADAVAPVSTGCYNSYKGVTNVKPTE